ncbi:MAG: 50S ribosomal protein L18Ae [Candidatus Nezhaarchaeales archaeon]
MSSEVKNFLVKGYMRVKGEWKFFTFKSKSLNEKMLLEKLYTELGGRNKLKRVDIKVEEIRILPEGEGIER